MTAVVQAGTALLRPNGRNGEPNPYRTEPLTDPDDAIHPPWPYLVVPGRIGLATVRQLRRSHPHASPVMLGSVYEVGYLLEGLARSAERPDPQSVDQVLQTADALDIGAWLAHDPYDDEDDEWGEWDEYAGLAWNQRLELKFLRKVEDWLERHDRSDGERPGRGTRFANWDAGVVIGLIPTDDPTTVPAHLRFGDFNGCDEPEYHVAVARHWKRRHGATLITCTHDVIEFEIARPVIGPRRVRRAAREYARYCGDADQMWGSAGNLRRVLRGARIWTLWWD